MRSRGRLRHTLRANRPDPSRQLRGLIMICQKVNKKGHFVYSQEALRRPIVGPQYT